MKINNKTFLPILIVLCVASLAAVSDAQSVLPGKLPGLNIKPTISLSASPKTPTPNSTVVITADVAMAAGADNFNYLWYVNGAKQKEASGYGRKSFIFQVGDLGSVYEISVNAAAAGETGLSDSILFTISDFDLTWSASSKTPAQYKGKALPTQNSNISVSALPFVYQLGTKTLYGADKLIYNWTINNKFSSANSGTGKDGLTFKNLDYAGYKKTIRLEITTSDGAISLIKSVEIPIVHPEILIYFADRETGAPFGSAIKNLTILPLELDFAAGNYFFNADSDDLDWQWSVGERAVNNKGSSPWLASLDISKISQNLAIKIEVLAKNSANDLEMARSIIDLNVK